MRMLSKAIVLASHEKLLIKYGGAGGIRDEAGLEAALSRADQLIAYSHVEPDIFHLAAAICYGLVKIHHPFIDGNKRTGFAALFQILYLNGYFLDTSEGHAIQTILSISEGSMSEDDFIKWVRSNCRKIAFD